MKFAKSWFYAVFRGVYKTSYLIVNGDVLNIVMFHWIWQLLRACFVLLLDSYLVGEVRSYEIQKADINSRREGRERVGRPTIQVNVS